MGAVSGCQCQTGVGICGDSDSGFMSGLFQAVSVRQESVSVGNSRFPEIPGSRRNGPTEHSLTGLLQGRRDRLTASTQLQNIGERTNFHVCI